ncbi:MAG: YihY/virulence factor BrkB family protein [Rhodothermales bacterium]
MASASNGLKVGLAMLKQTFSEFTDDDCPRMAAALAYYTIFSLPPLLVLIITLAGVVLSEQQVEEWISGQVGTTMGAQTSEQIQTMVDTAQERVSGGFSLGLILSLGGLLFGATGVFMQLQDALNTAWEVEPDPEAGGIKTFLTKRVFSLGMILVIAFLLLVSLLLLTRALSAKGQAPPNQNNPR